MRISDWSSDVCSSDLVYVGNPDAQASADSQVTLPASLDPADAMTDLGTVEVGAAAYGNVNASDSTVALKGSIGQFQVGGIDPTAADPLETEPMTVDATAAAHGNTSRLGIRREDDGTPVPKAKLGSR